MPESIEDGRRTGDGDQSRIDGFIRERGNTCQVKILSKNIYTLPETTAAYSFKRPGGSRADSILYYKFKL